LTARKEEDIIPQDVFDHVREGLKRKKQLLLIVFRIMAFNNEKYMFARHKDSI